MDVQKMEFIIITCSYFKTFKTFILGKEVMDVQKMEFQFKKIFSRDKQK